ncbi:MAG: HEAT repeat domain-containing protein [Planctomycetota bacterium]
MTEGGMKLYFCDICNESIPLGDLKENLATTIRGKLFCKTCNPLNTVPAAKPVPASALSPLAVVLVGLLLAALGYYGYHTLSQQLAERDRSVTDLTGRLQQLVARLDAETARTDGLVRKGVDRERVDALEAKHAQLAQLQEKNRQDVARLEDLIARLQGFQEKVTAVELQQQQLGAEVQNVRNDMEGVAHHLEQSIDKAITKLLLEIGSTRPGEGAASGTSAATPGKAAPEEQPIDDEANKFITKLADKDPGIRWEALDKLAARHDRRFLPNILPMLKDSDTFVQFRAIGAVFELGAREAVGDLIALLRDSDVIVREEALNTLVRLTGNQQLVFKANAPVDEREKGVKQWEDWYEKNKSQYK